MNKILTYLIVEQIYSSNRTVVHRAIEESSQQPVVLKLPNYPYPNFKELTQYRNSYSSTKKLNLPGVVKMLALEQVEKRLMLVMEDFGGISLYENVSNFKTSNLTNISEFFHIAIQITNILDQLHQNQVIHKDIKPHNIIINPQTKKIQLIDFSNATHLPKETLEIRNPHTLEGTLAYMSPEQTGRINRGIDYRSDFYSLGITFYELLTGQLPFQSTDPMELVHFHIARQPIPLVELNSSIPETLNNIVLKLMAKIPELRYQTAAGLRHDLKKCHSEWKNTGKITWFDLGQKDNSNRLIIPEKLYGREEEVEILLTAFERICHSSQSPIELMLVGGFSGIGKSALVNEIHQPIIEKKGYFIYGKFDQLQKDIPLAAWVNAFRDLVKQILSESEAKLKAIVAKLQRILGAEAQVIVDVIPELEMLIGKQPPVTKLSPSANQNRFNLLFPKFISVFAEAKHPLVIFLDDLQWADLTSLNLIKLVMEEINIHHLLLICAYRDNEVSASNPFILTIAEIRKLETIINEINLAPLSYAAINSLILDTFNLSPQKSQQLTNKIYQKTQGNPFFTVQFMKSLHKEGLIFYDFKSAKWQYNLAEIKVLAASGDVVDLMVKQLEKLPLSTQEALQLAACIGNQFDLATLSVVFEKSMSETATILWNALSEGLILPEDETYKFYQNVGDNLSENYLDQTTELSIPTYYFLHDRIQQAVYSLISQQKKQETHLKIGRLLLENTPTEQQEEKIFEIVNQLNYGIELISSLDQRIELARLNLKAGRKAKISTAYNTAIAYFNLGMNLLPENSWKNQYEITLTFHQEAAEVTYLNGEFEQMDKLVNIVLEKAEQILDKVKVYEIKIQACITLSQLPEALDIALSVLSLLGINIPHNPSQSDIQEYLQTTKTNLQGKNISELINLPLMQDPQKLAAMRILSSIFSLVFVGKPELLPLIASEPINLSLKSGNSPLFAFSCANYGLLLCGVEQDIDTGYQFGRLACELLENFNSKDQKTKVFQVVYHGIEHWKNHIQAIFPHVLEAYKIGLETGELEYAGYAILHYGGYSYLAGISLDKLESEITNNSNSLKQLKQHNNYYYNEICHQAILNLLGNSENPELLSGTAYDEEKFIPFYEEINDRYGLFQIYFHKLILSYLSANFQVSKHYATLAEEYINGVTGLFYFPVCYFYSSLAQLAFYPEAEIDEREKILTEVTVKQQKIKFWAEHAPTNHSHKYYLIEAEKQKIIGDKLAAMDAYEQAIALATENEYIQEAALANELCASSYLEWGKTKIAQTYILEAYYGYLNWGAIAKIKHLEKTYPQLLASIIVRPGAKIDSIDNTTHHSTNSSNTQNFLDIATVLKASQALSGEIQLENLLSTLIQLIMENAGAQKCALILLKEQQLVLEAIANVQNTTPNNQQYLQNFQRPVTPVSQNREIPKTLINYVWRTQKYLVFDDATIQATWANDAYIRREQPKSILCTPIAKQGQLIGILYLENNLTNAAFTPERLQLLEMITTQAAISLENALLYENLTVAKAQLEITNHTLEEKVQERTQELNEKNQHLTHTLAELQQTQTQLIQTEKMSSLGQLVAGVAHEINNPVNFIYGNLNYAQEYAKDLLDVISIYQENYPEPVAAVADIMAEVELDFLVEDLPNILTSMKVGADRIKEIVESLRNFSRLDQSEVKNVDIHEGIDSTLMILQNSLKAKPQELEISVVTKYAKLPKIDCYPGELNQVFMNIISNAIDALQPLRKERSERQPQITITTEIEAENQVIIRIADNGMGMNEAVQKRIFDPFYTTKPVGKGTGLGLAISYQVVVERHQGELECISNLGEGTEFVIKIPLGQL
ncbi:MAG: AAA family ATPase [Microcoleaceae cyanobacterium MO_207.B10]|nr:AAA family ATPase [Microcoleaceae cyanobacterium MO_207.B10]